MNGFWRALSRALLAAGLVSTLASCGKKPEKPKPSPAPAAVKPAKPNPVQLWYAQRAKPQLQTLGIRADAFRDAVNGLLKEPNAARLQTADKTWRGLYVAFNDALVPVSLRARLDSGLSDRLARTDPFPILPGYIDGLKQWPDSGIVNDVTVPITRQALIEQQGATSQDEVSLGFQVIHFLLHGEPGNAHTAGDFKEQVQTRADVGPDKAMPPANRRRDYLNTATDILVDDLKALSATPDDAVPVNSAGMITALQSVTDKLMQLEKLSGATDVAGEYINPKVRSEAMAALTGSLRDWLAPKSPLMDDLKKQGVTVDQFAQPLSGLDGKDAATAMKQLQAELAAAGDQLRSGKAPAANNADGTAPQSD